MQASGDPWIEAGGSAERARLWARLAEVELFSDGDSRCAAAVHPRVAELGAIWDWVGEEHVRVAAEEWLREQGCRRAVGPLMIHSWFPHRAVLGPFEDGPMAEEPRELPRRWTRAGYARWRSYVSVLARHEAVVSAAMSPAAALSAQGVRIEGLPERPSSAQLLDYFEDLTVLAERAFGEDELFAPIAAEQLAAWHAPHRESMDGRLLLRARDREGRVLGATWAAPDVADPERGWFLLRTLFLDPQQRDLGVGAWLVGVCHRRARQAGYRGGVHCMVPQGEGRRRPAGRRVREYALYDKAL